MSVVGFIGFGEVGGNLSSALKGKGAEVYTSDRDPERAGPKAKAKGIILLPSLEELVARSEYLFSCVWPDRALEVAERCARSPLNGKVYIDLNNISPQTAQRLEEVVEEAGGRFLKIGIMAPVITQGAKVPMLVGGKGADSILPQLLKWGLNVSSVGEDVRRPSAIKILRGILLKGMVALLFEMLAASRRFQVEEEVLASAGEFIEGQPFVDLANMFITSTALHAERRALEMEEVMGTLREAGIEPVMTLAIQGVFQWVAGKDLAGIFGQAPRSYKEVLEALLRKGA